MITVDNKGNAWKLINKLIGPCYRDNEASDKAGLANKLSQ